jgi:hypothetical protein
VHDPQGERDLLRPQPTRFALAVPAFGEIGEQRPHGRRQAEPVGQHLRNLAHGDEMALVSSDGPREPADDAEGPEGQHALPGGQRSHDAGHGLGG